MFASIRRYRLESGSIDDLLHLIDADFAERIQQLEGFLGYQVVECGNGEIITITTFEDRRSAEASLAVAADWVKDALTTRFAFNLLEGFVGEVAISRAREGVLEPARY
jgi:hypothetical protein